MGSNKDTAIYLKQLVQWLADKAEYQDFINGPPLPVCTDSAFTGSRSTCKRISPLT